MNRREFAGAALALGTRSLWGSPNLDETLRSGIATRKIPAVAAMVATADKTIYAGAFGTRDSASSAPVTVDSIFSIASMTKAITTTAALQCVEKGLLALNEPAGKYLPQLAKLDVLEGFEKGTGKPILRPAKKPVTLHHLLTHTSGFCYSIWLDKMLRFENYSRKAAPSAPIAPTLMFEPGTRWQYGTGLDWAGRMVEAVSGLTLEEYFQRNILKPLGMNDTTFILPPEKFDRLVSSYQRQDDGSLKQDAREMPKPPKAYNGGGGLYSTVGDYTRFMQMILRKGRGQGTDQILRPASVNMMSVNQIGGLSAGKLKTARPSLSRDVDFHPGAADKFTYGFLMNPAAYTGGRSAGSLAWAGFYNTFYWIDPKRSLCATIMMQYLPFVDTEAVGLLRDFERAVYSTTT